MPEANETRVLYRAIADFTALSRSVRKAKRDLAELRREEAKLNAQSVAGSTAATVANSKRAKSQNDLIEAFEKEATSVKKSTVRFIEKSNAVKDNTAAMNQQATATDNAAGATSRLTKSVQNTLATHEKWRKSADGTTHVYERNGVAMRRNRSEMTRFQRTMDSAFRSVTRLHRGLDKLDDWRPRLVPPFIALIPLVAGVLALINPLVAGLGAVGAAALGFASSLGRVAVGAIGIIPALATLISMIAALKTAFGGIGNAFKAFGAMQKAAGGGGGGAPQKEELTRTEKLQRAQEALARAIQDVQFAQEDLDDARKDYIKRLREMQKAVDRAAMSEARAAANAQLARENYMNVLADPGSTKGEKMDAQVSVNEADADMQDTIDKNKENAADLAKLKQDGIDGDRQVIMATRRVTDAIWAQRDAELALANALKDTNGAAGGGASAANQYAEALAKLSPSARRFVEELVAMKDAWAEVRRNVQESFFSEFVDDVQLLRKILPSVESLLSKTAGAVGRLADRFLKLITSPDWQRDLVLIGEQNVPIIENIGAALLAWVDAFKDLAIIAGPFFTDLTRGLKEGAERFQDLVASARANGSLASYLEEVRERMSQWWRIVKNIGKALFNFSAAAGDFGTWLTDGFEKVSEGWVKSSEKAREEGSPYQTYLEAIKPLLSQVKGLFADFFGWFARTSADPKNIGGFVDLVKTLREGLGPALSDLLQTLSDSGIGQKLAESITSIVESLDSIISSGGAEGFRVFFDMLTGFFGWLADTLENPIFGPVLRAIATSLGAITALSFIGKFTGLTSLFGWIFKLAKSEKVMKLLGKLPGAVKGLGAGVGSAAKTVGGDVLPLLKPGTLVKGGVIGALIAGAVQTVTNVGKGIGSTVGNISAVNGGKQTWQQAQKNMAHDQQAIMGPPGIGPITGLIDSIFGTTINEGWADLTDSFQEWLNGVVEDWGNFFTVDLPNWINGAVAGFQTWLTVDLPAWIAQVAQSFWHWLTVDLPYNIGYAAGVFLKWLTVDLPTWIGDAAASFWNWLTVEVPGAIAQAAAAFWKWLTVDLPAGIAAAAQVFWKWLTVDLPAGIRAAATSFWKWLTVDIPNGIVQAAQSFWKWLTVDIPAGIKKAADTFWHWLTVEIPNGIKNGINTAINGVKSAFNNFFAGLFAGFSGGKYNGGPILRRADGGGVPGRRSNSDTVAAMLTPGEFVVRKAIVNRVGMDNLVKLNAGVMSYAELLQRAMAGSQSSNSKSEKKNSGGGGVSFFDGGGLVPDLPRGPGGGFPPPATPPGFGGSEGAGSGFYVENLIINNPEPETASDSLPRTIRKLAYVGTSRGGRK